MTRRDTTCRVPITFCNSEPQRFRASRVQSLRKWGHHHTKPTAVAPEIRAVPVAVRASDAPVTIVERAAAQHAVSSIFWSTWVNHGRFGALFILISIVPIVAPLPHITSHVGAAIWRITLWGIQTNRRCAALPTFSGITFIRVELIPPRPLVAIGAAPGFLPFGFGRQTQS